MDSRYAKIMQVMQATEQNRPHLRRLGDRLGAWYTPIAVGVAALTRFITGDPLRFLAVVVIATPCPLLIAIPVAVIGAISLSARHGIIIKNPAVLGPPPDNPATLVKHRGFPSASGHGAGGSKGATGATAHVNTSHPHKGFLG